MTMDIVEAKRELYNQFKQYTEVTGAGIKGKTGHETIVIFLSTPNSKLVKLIPKNYKGNKVITEIRSIAKAV